MTLIPARRSLTATFVGLAALAGSAHGAATITNLRAFGAFTSGGISVDGLTVVGDANAGGYRWSSAGGFENIGSNGISGVSGDGSVVVGLSGRYTTASGWQSLGFSPSAVSGDGLTVVGCDSSAAYRWTSALGKQTLGTYTATPGDAHMTSSSVSYHGETIVGYYNTSSSGSQSFQWSKGNWNTTSQSLNFATSYYAVDGLGFRIGAKINPTPFSGATAQLIASLSAPASPSTTLPSLSGQFVQIGAMSSDGLVVGGSASNLAAIWTASTGTVTLMSYLTSKGVNLTGWTSFSSITGLSYDGSAITGYGTNNGQFSPFVVQLPTPGSAALLGMSGLIALRRRR